MTLNSDLFRSDSKLEAAATSDAAHIMTGASGTHVTKIQQALNILDSADLEEDGKYGTNTAGAVLRYKTRRQIINRARQSSADNIVGIMTMAAMDRELCTQSAVAVVIGEVVKAPRPKPYLGVRALSRRNLAESAALPVAVSMRAVVRGNPYVARDAKPVDRLPPSVPPGKTYAVKITVTPSLKPGEEPVTISISGSGKDNGEATVTPSEVRATTTVIVKGGQQTKAGHGGGLRIVAMRGGTELARSEGFSVCAHMSGMTREFQEDFASDSKVGLRVLISFTSDSGSNAHLDQLEWSELIEQGRRDEPPFSSGSGHFNNSGYLPALVEGSTPRDSYLEPRPSAGPRPGRTEALQVHMFRCARCGAADVAVPRSGYEIVHEVARSGGGWMHQTRCMPAAVGIRVPNSALTISTAAGGGGAKSLPHKL